MANTANTGVYSVDDLLAVRLSSAVDFGLENIYAALNADLAFYNSVVSDEMSLLAENVTEQQRVYGNSTTHRGTLLDEFGVAPSKKAFTTSNVSFPLYTYGYSVSWTQKFLEMASPSEVASEYLSIRAGHGIDVQNSIKKAVFNKDNFTFVDKNTNGVSLTIRRLVNADGQSIPDSQGNAFDGATHTHYLGISGSAVASADINSAVDTVTEHGHTKGLKLIIALADKSKVTGLSGFTALSYDTMLYNATDATVKKLDTSDLNNMCIGLWNGTIEIWVKPWAVANYMLVIADAAEKILGYRQRPQTSLQGLRLVSDIPGYPMVSKSFEAEFGLGVLNRTAGAVLYTSGSSFVNPSIA